MVWRAGENRAYVVTGEEIDVLMPGRPLDLLIEEKVMGRKVRLVKGPPCAWDGQGKAIMYAKDEYTLEDYNPVSDGIAVPGTPWNPKIVFDYSHYDLGMTRVMERMVAGPSLREFQLCWNSSTPKWVASIHWFDPDAKQVRAVHGMDEKFARLAVYRAALKAVMT